MFRFHPETEGEKAFWSLKNIFIVIKRHMNKIVHSFVTKNVRFTVSVNESRDEDIKISSLE